MATECNLGGGGGGGVAIKVELATIIYPSVNGSRALLLSFVMRKTCKLNKICLNTSLN